MIYLFFYFFGVLCTYSIIKIFKNSVCITIFRRGDKAIQAQVLLTVIIFWPFTIIVYVVSLIPLFVDLFLESFVYCYNSLAKFLFGE
jgi:hypothetical protein